MLETARGTICCKHEQMAPERKHIMIQKTLKAVMTFAVSEMTQSSGVVSTYVKAYQGCKESVLYVLNQSAVSEMKSCQKGTLVGGKT